MEFEFLLDNRRFDVDGIEIKPRHDHEEIVRRFYETAYVGNGWVYPPLKTVSLTATESSKFKNQASKVTSNFFTVQPTHSITIHPHNEEKAKFLILSYGFLHGLYLSPAGYLCLNKIPYEEGKLTGVILVGNDHQKGMRAFNFYYDRSYPEERKQMFAILHWLLIGQTYNFAWDRFDAQYKVLDGLYRTSGIKSDSHASRPVDLAAKYGVQLPDWAKLINSKPKTSRLSIIRNELVHEAKYAGHPIGYEYPEENFGLEFVAFNLKLVAAVVGLNTKYLEAEPSNRCRYSWNFA